MPKRNYLVTLLTNIRRRCYDPALPAYKYYGARGIKMHTEWIGCSVAFQAWILDNLGHRPTEKHSLDRIDNDGDYVPGNLKWSTSAEQNRNRRQRSPKPVMHGTSNGYTNYACRCADCKTAYSLYYKQRRLQQRSALF